MNNLIFSITNKTERMDAKLLFTGSGENLTIARIFNETQIGKSVTMSGLLLIRTEDELIIRKVKDEVFVNTDTNKKFCFENGLIKFIDKLRCVISKETYPDSKLQLIFAKYPDIDYVVNDGFFIKMKTSCTPNPKSSYTGYQGMAFIGDFLFEGFEFIDVENGKNMIWQNKKLSEKN